MNQSIDKTRTAAVRRQQDSDDSNYEIYGVVAERVRTCLEQGQQLNVDDLIAEHPALANQIQELVPALTALHQMGHAPQPTATSSATSPSESPLHGQLGDYVIVRELGRGGMGVVYEAEQKSLHRRVALKVLPFAAVLDQRQLQRFKNEALAAAQLDHANIVPVHGVGCERGVHYYVMRYIQGRTISEVIDELRKLTPAAGSPDQRQLSAPASSLLSGCAGQSSVVAQTTPITAKEQQPVDRGSRLQDMVATEPINGLSTNRSTETKEFFRSVVQMGVQIAEALEHAHGQGIVHRDVKPSNIILDVNGKPWVTDFGLARIETDKSLTISGDLIGTLRYMSPEQALAKRVGIDHRTDIYSLGATLYELFTLHPAFKGEDRTDLLRKIAFEEPVAPRRLNSSLSFELETIVLKAMSKNPAERYGNAQELADDLTRFLEDKPILAKRPTLPQRAAKWSRRHKPIVVSAAVATTIVLMVVTIGAALMAGQERDRRIAAVQARVAAEQAKDRESRLLRENKKLLVASYVDRAHGLCKTGEIGRGMLWFARSLRSVPQDAADLEHVIRTNLAVWRQRLHSLSTLVQHQSRVQAVAFSPEGLRILTGCEDGTAQIWDAATGWAIGAPLQHPAAVRAVVFSPDCSQVLTGCADGTVLLWDAARRTPIGEPIGVGESVNMLAFSPDGARMVTVSQAVRIWDTTTFKEVRQPFQVGVPMAIQFSPHGLRAVVLSAGNCRLWDVDGGEAIGPPVPIDTRTAAISPDGKTFATVSGLSTIKLWDAATGKRVGPPILHGGVVHCMAFTPDGSGLLSGGNTRAARLWDVESGQLIGEPLWQQTTVFAVGFDVDGSRVLTGSDDGSVRLWEMAGDRARGESIEHEDPVLTALYSPDGLRLVTKVDGAQSTFQLRDAATGDAVGPPIFTYGNWEGQIGPRLQFSPDGSQLLTKAGSLKDVATGQPVGPLLASSFSRFSPDGSRILAGFDGVARLFDTNTREPIGEPLQHFNEEISPLKKKSVFRVAFSPDGSLLLTGGWDGTCRVWDAATLAPIGEPLIHPSEVKSLACSPDGSRMLAGFADGTVRLWDLTTRKPVGVPLHHQEVVSGVAFSPDGSRFITSSLDGTAQLWDTATLKPIGPPLEYDGFWPAVSFSPDGREILVSDAWPAAPQLWPNPPGPVEGDRERIVLWTQVLSGLQLDPNGGIIGLDGPTWLELHRQLEKLGGPPTTAPLPAPVAKVETDFSRSMELAISAHRLAEQEQWEKAADKWDAALELSDQSPALRQQVVIWLHRLAATQLGLNYISFGPSELLKKLAQRPELQHVATRLRDQLGEELSRSEPRVELELKAARQAAQDDPSSRAAWATWSRSALAYYRDRNWEGAESEARLAVELSPDNPYFLLHIVPFFVMTGNHDEYREVCEQLMQRSGMWRGHRLVSALTLCSLDPQPSANTKRFRQLARRVFEESPSWSLGSVHRANCRLGEWDRAIEFFESKESPNSQLDAAIAHHLAGHHADARNRLEQAHQSLESWDSDAALPTVRMVCEVLRCEAERLILGSQVGTSPKHAAAPL